MFQVDAVALPQEKLFRITEEGRPSNRPLPAKLRGHPLVKKTY